MVFGRATVGVAAALMLGTLTVAAQAPGRWDSPANEVFEFNVNPGSR